MSDAVADNALKAYLQESNAWDQDRLEALRIAVRRAWQVAAAAGICALAASLALVLLMPLKSSEPFLIRVDSSTGVVDVVPVYAGQLQAAQSVTRYFLSHYVTVCQRFNLATAESDYEECGAFHTAHENQLWAALWNRANPQSPLNLHRDGGDVSVQIESVSFIQRVSGVADLAQVRYLKIERSTDGLPQLISHWIATVQYAYAAVSKDPGVRRWNPLGFKIVNFVAEPEVNPDPSAEPPTTLAPENGAVAPAESLRAAQTP